MTYRGSCHCGGIRYEVEGELEQGSEVYAVNARCLEGVDLAGLKRVPYDGRSK